jgi:hypothetical protein
VANPKRSLFVKSGTVRLDLEGELEGYWIEVKQGLTYKERAILEASVLTSAPMGGATGGEKQYGVDMARFRLTQLQTWIVDWNFEDERGKQMDVRRQNLENLEPDVAEALIARIEQYEAERRTEGKASGPSNGSLGSPASSSPPAGVGAS